MSGLPARAAAEGTAAAVSGAAVPVARGRIRLSDHFRLAEFDCRDGTPVPEQAVPALRELVRGVLEPLRAQFGPCTVLSAYRHESYNARLRPPGARFSFHIYELRSGRYPAVDVAFRRGTPREWARAANAVLARKYGRDVLRRRRRGGIGTYVRSGFVHIDPRPYRADWSG